MKHTKLREYIRKEITSILSESKLNETLNPEVFNMLDKILIHMKAEDLVEELIRVLSTSDAKFYLSSIMKEWGIPSSQEDYDALSENDEEPTKAELKKKDSVASISNKLQKLVQDMKDKAKEYKAAEGEEKEKIKDELKKMTKEKKELEKSI